MVRLFSILALGVAVLTVRASAAERVVLLTLSTNGAHDLTLKDLGAAVCELRTTGSDPFLRTLPIPQPFDPREHHVLSFEYFSLGAIDHLQVFTIPPGDEAHSLKAEGLSVSEGWSWHALDLAPILPVGSGALKALRLDFGSQPGKVLQIRSLQLRPSTPRERELAARREEQRERARVLETHLGDYLHRSFPCRITQVGVDEQRILVDGEAGPERESLFLAEVPMFENVTELRAFRCLEPLHPDPTGRFSLTVSRHRFADGRDEDRLLSRWAVVRARNGTSTLLSSARYADVVQSRWNLPEEKPRNKKGLGAFWQGRPLSDLEDLDISAVTVNINLSGLMRTSPGPGRIPFEFSGRAWYADERAVGQLDQTLVEAARRHLIVSAIILVSQAHASPDAAWGRLVAHPDADPAGIYVMPNVSSEAGLEAYAAALDFLARRYSQPDKAHGRIHHWIMHNEVDAGWEWTNAGDKTALLYLDHYHKSLRAAHLIARQYNPDAKAFISLTHFWAKTPDKHFYPAKQLLELLLDFSRVEGDFDWAIAQHPYPEDLANPRVWADRSVNETFDTPQITFKNIEVLDAWVSQPAALYLGRHRRTVHLSEQGLNSPDYSERALQEQAAGLAYAWHKLEHLESIETFHYHNWVDNRGEGGLRIGLRKFPDETGDPLGKKPIWSVYEAVGTPHEEAATAFALPIIGIREWREITPDGTRR